MAQDNEIWAAIFGGLIGAALASPKPEDKKDLNEYRRFKQEINIRQQKIGILPNFNKLNQKPQYYNGFIEAYKTYLYGFSRSSVIVSSALMESILKEKFGNEKFYNLIEKAKKDSYLTDLEYHLLHGLRSERNESAHDVLREIRDEDAVMVLQITIKIINNLIKENGN